MYHRGQKRKKALVTTQTVAVVVPTSSSTLHTTTTKNKKSLSKNKDMIITSLNNQIYCNKTITDQALAQREELLSLRQQVKTLTVSETRRKIESMILKIEI